MANQPPRSSAPDQTPYRRLDTGPMLVWAGRVPIIRLPPAPPRQEPIQLSPLLYSIRPRSVITSQGRLIDFSLPPNVPTEPAAMRATQEQQQQRRRQRPRQRRRERARQQEQERQQQLALSPQPPPPPRRRIQENFHVLEEPLSVRRRPVGFPPAATGSRVETGLHPATQPQAEGRYVQANVWGRTPAGASVVLRTEPIYYPSSQQAADYAALLADSEPEQSWESRRHATMVAPGSAWLEADLYSVQWYNAIVLSYQQDRERGGDLAGTEGEQSAEAHRREAGHPTGVSVEMEVKRRRFDADLMVRARDMVLRDNGILPRNALARPPRAGEEPQPWAYSTATMPPTSSNQPDHSPPVAGMSFITSRF